MCVNDAPQCCTNSFVDRLKVIVRQRLEEFLREEYEDVVHDSLEELDNLLDCECMHGVVYHKQYYLLNSLTSDEIHVIMWVLCQYTERM